MQKQSPRGDLDCFPIGSGRLWTGLEKPSNWLETLCPSGQGSARRGSNPLGVAAGTYLIGPHTLKVASSILARCIFSLVAGWRLEAGGCRLQAGGWRLQASGCRLEAVGCSLQAGGWRLQAGRWGQQAAGCRLEA